MLKESDTIPSWTIWAQDFYELSVAAIDGVTTGFDADRISIDATHILDGFERSQRIEFAMGYRVGRDLAFQFVFAKDETKEVVM